MGKKKSYKNGFILDNDTQFYKTLLDSIKDWIYWIDRDGNIIYASPSTKIITGYEPDKFLKEPKLLEKIIHPDDRDFMVKIIREEKLNKDICSRQFRIITKQGEVKHILHSCVPVFSENKREIIGRIATNRDITDIVRTKQETEASEKLLQSILDSFPDPVNMIDKDYKIVFANKKLLSLINKDLEEIKGNFCYKVYQKRNKICEICAPKKVFETGKTETVEKELPISKNNIKYFETRAFPVKNEKGEIVYAIEITRDITERKILEKALKESKVKYKQLSQKAPIGVISSDTEGNINFVNEEALRILGSPSAEATMKINLFTFPPLIKAGISEKIKKCVETGKEQNWEGIYGSKWGKNSYMRLKANPLFEKEKVVGVLFIIEDFTQRKQIESELEKNIKMFYGIFSNTKNGMLIARKKDYKIIDLNPAMEEIIGYSKDEIIDKTVFDIIYLLLPEKNKNISPIDYKNIIKEKLQNSIFLKDFNKIVREIKIRKKNGEERILEHIGFMVKTGEEDYFIAIMRDITESKKVFEQLKKSEEKYKEISQMFRLIADNNPDMLWAKDLKGRYLFINKRMAVDLFGFKNNEYVLNKTDKDIIEEIKAEKPDRDDWYYLDKDYAAIDQDILKKKKPIRYEVSGFIRGKYHYFDVFKAPLKNEKGEIIGTVGSAREITEQKQLELEKENARKAIQRLAEVIRQSSEAIIITDRKAKIIYANPAFEKITGYKLKEVIGKNPNILKSGKMDKDFYKEMWKTILSGKSWHGTFINKKKDGSLIYESATIFPIFNEKKEIINFAAVKRDITGEKKLEEQLLQAQKMEAIGNLTGGVAHDFNNLLTVINGYSDIALKRLNEDDPSYKIFKAINEAGTKAEKLIKHLLAFSRKQVYKPQVLNINSMIKKMEKLLKRYIPEDIKLKITLEERLPNIKADPNQIDQILINLVINARDAINEKPKKSKNETITIETGKKKINKKYLLKHPDARVGSFIYFSVSDTGVGIDDNIKDRIFEPFFTTKGKTGSGLGLSTVYGIVKQNNGFIYLYSEKGQGTTFKIYWPITKEKRGKIIKEKEKEATPKGKNEIILFVEDEKEILKFASTGLKALGYKVILASNGKEALEILKTKKIIPEILVTDLIMPDLDGEELAKEVKKKYPKINIIYTSGYTDNHIVNKGILNKNVNFISKPYTISELSKKIREVLDKKDK